MADRRSGGLPILIAAALPVLATRIGMGFLRYQARRKRGVRAFRKALLRSGMPADRADRLAQAYHEFGSVRRLVQGGLRQVVRAGPRPSRPDVPST